MIDVLLITGIAPQPGILAAAVEKFKAKGARVYLAGAINIDKIPPELALDGFCPFPADIARSAYLRKAERVPSGQRVWIHIQREAKARRWGRRAHVLVALDAHAVYTVWRFAQMNRGALAQYGITPALQAIDKRGRQSKTARTALNALPSLRLITSDVRRLARSLPAATARVFTARPVMRSRVGTVLWQAAVGAPGLSERLRMKVTQHVTTGMDWANNSLGHARILNSAARHVTKVETKAEMLEVAATKELAAGVTPRNLAAAVETLLAVADRAYSKDQYDRAAEYLGKSFSFAFHRLLHLDQLTSPLAADPAGYVAPFQRSTAARAIGKQQGRATPAAPPPIGRPLRLLIATASNVNFLPLIRDRYEKHRDVEVRFFHLAEDPDTLNLTRAMKTMIHHRLVGTSPYGQKLEEQLRPHLDWADTVFVDWCTGPAAIFSLVDPGSTRLIVRLHSYEAFSRWPQMIDFSRIDDLVFVANHIRDLTVATTPQLSGPGAPRIHVLHNAMDLRGFQREKRPESRFQLGMVGINQVAKDPLWAVDVLRALRSRDPRYRLLLVGDDINPESSPATRGYFAALNRALAPLEQAGVVRRIGRTDNVPEVLSEVGVILSTSVREGCHCGLMEGAASGAIPVVRDWPFFAGRPNSARTMYPEGWVVGSPKEAAQRILATTADETTWQAAGNEAAQYALNTWDWSVVQHDFDRLLLSGP